MGRRNFLIGLTGLLALAGLTCAPRHQDPPTNNQTGPSDNSGGFEHVPDLKGLVQRTLQEIKDRPLHPKDGFWTIFHAILGMGLDTELVLDNKERVKAIDYIAAGKPMPGLEFLKKDHGLDVRTTGPQGGLMAFDQGHQDQFIAEMAQWGISRHMPFRLSGYKEPFTFMDFCQYSKMRASVDKSDDAKNQELSWAIIIIGEYFPEIYRKNGKGEIEYVPWENAKGEKLNYEDIVRYEVNEPIKDDAACGGTHRLFGLTWAYHKHLRRGGQTTGVWRDVAAKINEYKRLAKDCQNEDGSFSTKWWERGGMAKPVDARVATTGHILEWLALALTDKELKQEWVHRAVRAQCLMILYEKGKAMEGGGLYHATHGLNLFDARVFSVPSDPRLLPVPLPPNN